MRYWTYIHQFIKNDVPHFVRNTEKKNSIHVYDTLLRLYHFIQNVFKFVAFNSSWAIDNIHQKFVLQRVLIEKIDATSTTE